MVRHPLHPKAVQTVLVPWRLISWMSQPSEMWMQQQQSRGHSWSLPCQACQRTGCLASSACAAAVALFHTQIIHGSLVAVLAVVKVRKVGAHSGSWSTVEAAEALHRSRAFLWSQYNRYDAGYHKFPPFSRLSSHFRFQKRIWSRPGGGCSGWGEGYPPCMPNKLDSSAACHTATNQRPFTTDAATWRPSQGMSPPHDGASKASTQSDRLAAMPVRAQRGQDHDGSVLTSD